MKMIGYKINICRKIETKSNECKTWTKQG